MRQVRPSMLGALTAFGLALLVASPGSGADADSAGRELWRMRGLKSNAVTTPLGGDGVVVFSSGYPSKMSEEGDTYVVKAGPEFEIVGQNPLDEPIGASAAVAGGRIYIRGQKHLFAIGDAPAS